MHRPLFAALALLACAGTAAAQARPGAAPCDSAAPCAARVVTPDNLDRTAAHTFSELLAGRVPGLYVRRTSGALGAGARLVLRGPSQILFPESPLIVVDGIRAASQERAPGSLGAIPTVSAFDELDPEEIDSIRVLPGPAAAARYGPAASGGVIEVTTRRGSGAGFHVAGFAGVGARQDAGDYPANYERPGTFGTTRVRCWLARQASGGCTPIADSLYAFNPLRQSGVFRTGALWTGGARVDGGSGPVRWLAFASHGSEQGVEEENSGTRTDLHGRVSFRPLPAVELAAGAQHLRRDLRLPFEGSFLSPLAGGLFGSARDDSLHGFRSTGVPYGTDYAETTFGARRTLAWASGAWDALPWLRLEARYGIDYGLRDGVESVDSIPTLQPATLDSTTSIEDLRTAAGSARLRFRPLTSLVSTTGAGVEHTGELLREHRIFLFGSPPAGSAQFESRTRRRILGAWLSESLGWRGTVQLDGVVRRDEPRGGDALWSGSAALAWSLGDEAFFHRPAWLGALRLRGAWGRVDAFPGALAGMASVPEPIIICTQFQPCDTELKPQRTNEAEAGFDAALFGRLALELTGYRRETSRILSVIPLPSTGGLTFTNMGAARNTGVEGALRLDGIAAGPARVDLELLGAANRNRVSGLRGPLAAGNNWLRNGAPFGGYWVRPITGFGDLTGDGLIGCPTPAGCEVTVGDTAEFAGNAFPTRMLGAAARVHLGTALTVGARVEHQGGYRLFDQAEFARCAIYRNCAAANDPATPLDAQAAVVAGVIGTPAGFIHDASFTRLREVTVTFAAPAGFARAFGSAGVELTLAGQNLATWTAYPGLDPEIDSAALDNVQSFQGATPPLPRVWTARLDVRF